MPSAQIERSENGTHKLVRRTIEVKGATILRPRPTRPTLLEWMASKGLMKRG